VFLDMPAMQQPEAYIGGGGSLFDDSGKITAEATQKFVDKFVVTFANWVETHAK
jgi:chromate reductase